MSPQKVGRVELPARVFLYGLVEMSLDSEPGRRWYLEVDSLSPTTLKEKRFEPVLLILPGEVLPEGLSTYLIQD